MFSPLLPIFVVICGILAPCRAFEYPRWMTGDPEDGRSTDGESSYARTLFSGLLWPFKFGVSSIIDSFTDVYECLTYYQCDFLSVRRPLTYFQKGIKHLNRVWRWVWNVEPLCSVSSFLIVVLTLIAAVALLLPAKNIIIRRPGIQATTFCPEVVGDHQEGEGSDPPITAN